MDKILVIVESPGKIKKIGEYLGPEYIVKASYGHFLDLPSDELAVDVNNNFEPTYKVTNDKRKVVSELQSLARQCKEVIIASDEDREGEKIGADLATVLKLKDPKRIIFHEITKKAINDAVLNPSKIDFDMVKAQQTRRILDRLVGYKISPLLWSNVSGSKSAGRVQSVVVKIIIDKENDIENSISSPYFKTSAIFRIKKQNTNSNLLIKGKKGLFKFENYELAKNWIELIGENTSFKIMSVKDREAIRKPSPPFTTSTLQQDASSKLHFNVKRTMDAAQKLYEAGHITYMRTDSTNLSKEALKKCEEYIKEKYGDKYSNSTNYNKKSKNAQEAHEAIRPTNIKVNKIKDLTSDCIRLYQLIWKRTVASQMSHAILNLQTIEVDAFNYPNNKKSILPGKSIFSSTLESIKFDGFLKLYNNKSQAEGDNDNSEEENEEGEIKVKKGDKVKFKQIKISEEYTKPPLRYNEAGLIKNLEKQGIGRPSTYASIISKIISRDYVRINNVDGVEKKSRLVTISNKFKLSEEEKKLMIGKEKNKIIPTDMGKSVNNFLIKNFEEIMEVSFTAKFEKYLDKIAAGKAKWFNILEIYYQKFNPSVEKINKETLKLKKEGLNREDTLLGEHPESKLPIYFGSSKYGPYVKILEEKSSTKWRYSSIGDLSTESIDLETAINLLAFPKYIGKIDKSKVYLCKGKYGFYVKIGAKKNISLKDSKLDINKVSIDDVKYLLNNQSDPYALKTFEYKKRKIHLKNGPYGHYLQIVGKKKQNISVPPDVDIEILDLETVLGIIAMVNGTKRKNK